MGHLDVIVAYDRHEMAPDADRRIINGCIEEIRACIAERRPEDAKLLLAQLLFDFQPLIVRDTGLKAIIVSLLDQCDAFSLQQRLLIAAGAIEGLSALP
jgi:hypothetical protein